MVWQARLGVGFVLAVAAAVACTSTNNSPLGGQGTGAGPDGGDPCPTGTAASDGQGYVQNRGCAKCHGNDMAGQTTYLHTSPDGGTYPITVFLYPPNLTPDPTTGLGNWQDADVAFAIIHGVDNNSQKLCPEMQHYTGMCENEADGIVAYLRSIPAVVKVIPQSICPPLKMAPPGFDAGP